MIPESIAISLSHVLPISLSRIAGLWPRLVMQIAASALLTTFYTPGGAAGWILDLVLRGYFALHRSPPSRFSLLSIRLPVLARVSGGASRTGQRSSKTEQFPR